MSIVKTKNQLTNMQLELLKMFSVEVPEADLKMVRNMLANFFAERATEEAVKAQQKNKWTNKEIDSWANNHKRLKK